MLNDSIFSEEGRRQIIITAKECSGRYMAWFKQWTGISHNTTHINQFISLENVSLASLTHNAGN